MNISDFAGLKGLALPIVVPHALPAGFVLKRTVPMPDDDGDGYSIEWSSGDATLQLFGVSGGIGDRMEGEQTVEFHHPSFGDGRVELENGQLATSWMSEMSEGLPAYSLVGRGVSQEQFLQTVLSLNYIKL